MGDLTPHFSTREFVCKDGTYEPMNCAVLAMLEAIRCHFGPVSVVSGYRSPSWNAHVGGATDSYHVKSMAADIQVVGVSPKEVYKWCDKQFPISGLGLYKTFTHVDCRGYRARWKG